MTSRPVAWATDAAYVRHAAASIHSVLDHDPLAEPHLLTAPDVAQADLTTLRGMVEAAGRELHVHRMGTEVDDLPVMARIGPVMWYRILLPDLLPAETRVLYLDADTIVRRDLAPLFDLDLAEAVVGAVDNVTEPSHQSRTRELGIPADQPYFNSGVLLFDLTAMRADALGPAIVELARQRPLAWPDQDALNLVLGGRRHHLHPRWNCQNSLYHWTGWAAERFGADVVAEATADPAILHFEGPGMVKPWHTRCDHPRRHEYLEHAAATPWGRPKLDRDPIRRRADQMLRRLRGVRRG